MKKVLILTPDLNKPGGVANYVLSTKDLYKEVDTHFFTRGSRNDTNSYMVPLLMIFDYFRYIFKLIIGGFDLIHINVSLGRKNLWRDPFFIWAAKLLGLKVLLFIHGWDELHESNSRGLRIFLKSDVILVLAEEFKEKIISKGYTNKVIVETTVVADDFTNQFTSEQVMDNPPPEIANILFLSRMEKEKGVYQIIDAFRLLQQEFQNLKLTLAGDGPEMEAVKEYISVNGLTNIETPGYVMGQQKVDIFKNAQVFAFPTFYGEGMPISLLEAMIAGLPVVTRPVGGIRDFFESGTMGFVTESKEPSIIAELIKKLIVDPNLTLDIAKFNYQYAREHFTAPVIVKRLEKIYQEIA